jgi:hypothetical protein
LLRNCENADNSPEQRFLSWQFDSSRSDKDGGCCDGSIGNLMSEVLNSPRHAQVGQKSTTAVPYSHMALDSDDFLCVSDKPLSDNGTATCDATGTLGDYGQNLWPSSWHELSGGAGKQTTGGLLPTVGAVGQTNNESVDVLVEFENWSDTTSPETSPPQRSAGAVKQIKTFSAAEKQTVSDDNVDNDDDVLFNLNSSARLSETALQLYDVMYGGAVQQTNTGAPFTVYGSSGGALPQSANGRAASSSPSPRVSAPRSGAQSGCTVGSPHSPTSRSSDGRDLKKINRIPCEDVDHEAVQHLPTSYQCFEPDHQSTFLFSSPSVVTHPYIPNDPHVSAGTTSSASTTSFVSTTRQGNSSRFWESANRIQMTDFSGSSVRDIWSNSSDDGQLGGVGSAPSCLPRWSLSTSKHGGPAECDSLQPLIGYDEATGSLARKSSIKVLCSRFETTDISATDSDNSAKSKDMLARPVPSPRLTVAPRRKTFQPDATKYLQDGTTARLDVGYIPTGMPMDGKSTDVTRFNDDLIVPRVGTTAPPTAHDASAKNCAVVAQKGKFTTRSSVFSNLPASIPPATSHDQVDATSIAHGGEFGTEFTRLMDRRRVFEAGSSGGH